MDFVSVLFFMTNSNVLYECFVFITFTILTNSSLCSGRDDDYLCFYTTEEIINYRKGEDRESARSLSSSFPNIRLCTQRGWNVGIGHEALALAVVILYPAALL